MNAFGHDPVLLVLLTASLTALTGAILWLGSKVNTLSDRVSRMEGILDVTLGKKEE